MLASLVSLHDIDDVEGFVAGAIEKSGIRASLSETEHEDLIAEGICILYELERKYEPHRAGYDQPGRFSGYAAQYLPRRLGDAWHARNPEHRRVTGEDGRRRWVYTEQPISLDMLFSESVSANGYESQSIQASHQESKILPHASWTPVAVQ